MDAWQFPFRYTVLHQGVFWLIWDASSAQISDDSLTWARQQLASSAAATADVLVVGHLPMVGISQGKDRPGEILNR